MPGDLWLVAGRASPGTLSLASALILLFPLSSPNFQAALRCCFYTTSWRVLCNYTPGHKNAFTSQRSTFLNIKKPVVFSLYFHFSQHNLPGKLHIEKQPAEGALTCQWVQGEKETRCFANYTFNTINSMEFLLNVITSFVVKFKSILKYS